MRLTFLLLACLALQACGSSSAGKLEMSPSAQASGPVSSPTVRSSPAPTATRAPRVYTDADFVRHVKLLKEDVNQKLKNSNPRASAADFAFVIQRPFVVVGDEPKAAVQQHALSTVKWAVSRLKQDFFPHDPKEILDIWLFKDAASYEKNAVLLFGAKPTTPYGYYSSSHKALVMNIETGGGTLVHEIVHPFVEANFPECPPWLNEGLGSLFEQCGDVDGHIHGFTNWRLAGLQEAIRAKQVPSFLDLTALDADGFYNHDRGVNYAQSRYLCYYLQQRGVLVKFYQEFYAQRKDDPTGFKSLQKTLAEADMNAFKTRWEEFVLKLRNGDDVTVN
ncbi:MAG TPA: hypothetical protein VLL54_01160 [Pyrinomonadaceae bacterium]|nr:hypothetical protein [Pyrinomonadaceae bacterium]